MHALPNNTIHASRSADILEDDMDTYKESGWHTRPLVNRVYTKLNDKVIEIEESMSRESLMLTRRQKSFKTLLQVSKLAKYM